MLASATFTSKHQPKPPDAEQQTNQPHPVISPTDPPVDTPQKIEKPLNPITAIVHLFLLFDQETPQTCIVQCNEIGTIHA